MINCIETIDGTQLNRNFVTQTGPVIKHPQHGNVRVIRMSDGSEHYAGDTLLITDPAPTVVAATAGQRIVMENDGAAESHPVIAWVIVGDGGYPVTAGEHMKDLRNRWAFLNTDGTVQAPTGESFDNTEDWYQHLKVSR